MQFGAAADPEVIDKFDGDRSIDEVAELIGTNPDLVRSDDEVDEIRAARAEQAQQSAESAGAAKDIAQAAQTAAQTANEIEDGGAKQLLQSMGPLAGSA